MFLGHSVVRQMTAVHTSDSVYFGGCGVYNWRGVVITIDV